MNSKTALMLIMSAFALLMTGCEKDKPTFAELEITTNISESVTTNAEKQISAVEMTQTDNYENTETNAMNEDIISESIETENNYQDYETSEQEYNNDNEVAESEEISENETLNSTGEFTINDLVFEYNGQTINLDENITDVTARIGEPSDMVSAPSCYYDGDDKTFKYDGFNIHTYPDGKNDYVVSIEFITDAVSTTKGVRVGMSIDEALSIYGSDYTSDGINYQYIIDDKYMSFYVLNGVINNINIVYAN